VIAMVAMVIDIGMLIVETIGKIRRAYFGQGKPLKAVCQELGVSRKMVRKVVRSEATEFRCQRTVQPWPKLGPWQSAPDDLLVANAGKAPRERLIRLFEELQGPGYEDGYDAVRRHARAWGRAHGAAVEDFVPLELCAGRGLPVRLEAGMVLIGGTTVTVKVAHVRPCHSWMPFVRAYPHETQETAFDAHDRAFAFFRGACRRGIYDNMKTPSTRSSSGGSGPTTAASYRCAPITWLIRFPAHRPRAGRKGKSKTNSAWRASASSHRGCR
jgi:transposase